MYKLSHRKSKYFCSEECFQTCPLDVGPSNCRKKHQRHENVTQKVLYAVGFLSGIHYPCSASCPGVSRGTWATQNFMSRLLLVELKGVRDVQMLLARQIPVALWGLSSKQAEKPIWKPLSPRAGMCWLWLSPQAGRNLENVGVNPLNRPDPTTWAHVRAELSLCLWEKSDGENWREQNLSEITATGDSHPAWGLSPGFWDTNTLTFGIYISPRFTTVNWITFVNLNTCVRSVTNRSHQFRIVNTLKK